MGSGLNDQQQQAVTAGEGPVMIVAGPGTGKTKTLVARIVHLLESGKARPEQILALTFTKKAAQEMQSRVAVLVSGDLPQITTFHALCNKLLENEMPFVADTERLQIIKGLSRPKNYKDLSVRELVLAISNAKNQPIIEDAEMSKIVRAYDKALRLAGLRDFDDLLVDVYQLLTADATKRAVVQDMYRYILVDEFQDTNRLQYEILKMILGNDNIFVIGDPNQSIYGFRGASDTIFETFRTDFLDRAEITLTTNYRSAPQVVSLANAIFPDTPDLASNTRQSGIVRAVEVLNEYGEAEWVLAEIQRSIGGGDLLKAVSDDISAHHRRLSDFAVLYRSRPAALTFQKLLADSGLPYQVVGEGSPYEQPQIQAILTLMQSAVTGEPVRLAGYGSAEQRLLEEEMAKVESARPGAMAERIIKILGIETSRDMQQFAGSLVRFKDVSSALAYFEETAEHGFYDASADAITLLTIHASKGLEFPYVFLLGAEEGILPSHRGDEAEERRLFYVAVTRARERLEITHAKNRGGNKAEASRFVRSLPNDILKRLIDPTIDEQLRRIAKRAAKKSQTSLF
jgi:superfamily I DNA/RNA helicase